MKEETSETIALCVVTALLVFFVTFSLTRRGWELDAVKLGHAEYYFDINYTKRWRWKTNAVPYQLKTNLIFQQDSIDNYQLKFVD